MGEYYSWVNVDKKEYLQPGDFDLGQKSIESTWERNKLLQALYELLSTDWKGCHILFLGDECNAVDDETNEVIKTILKHKEESNCSGYLFDTVYDTYRNVSCLFKEAEDEVRNEIRIYLHMIAEEDDDNDDRYIPPNEYGIDTSDPYNGLFLREGKSFKYTINRTKKVFYSLEETKFFDRDGTEIEHIDPLPVLMRYGRSRETGVWLGDIIDVSDILPEDCTLLKEIHLDW